METQEHDDHPDESPENADTPPALPAEDDDSPAGDTDQHSDADA